MTISTQASSRKSAGASVVALHCSLGSGRQRAKLAAEFGAGVKLIAPDLIGYGNRACAEELVEVPLAAGPPVAAIRRLVRG